MRTPFSSLVVELHSGHIRFMYYSILANWISYNPFRLLVHYFRSLRRLNTPSIYKSGNQLAIRTNNANNNRLFAEGRLYGGVG
jgi:hypothetical protein